MESCYGCWSIRFCFIRNRQQYRRKGWITRQRAAFEISSAAIHCTMAKKEAGFLPGFWWKFKRDLFCLLAAYAEKARGTGRREGERTRGRGQRVVRPHDIDR